MLSLGLVQSFWGPQQDQALRDAGMLYLVDFVDLMPSRYGALSLLAMGGDSEILQFWGRQEIRLKGLQGFFFGTNASLSRASEGFSTAQRQIFDCSVLAGRLGAEFLILGSPSSRELTGNVSEPDILNGYLELSCTALEAGPQLLIENLPVAFENHGLSTVRSMLDLAERVDPKDSRIGYCLDLGNHFSHHTGNRNKAFSEAKDLIETGLVRHLQVNLLSANSLLWCHEFLANVVDGNSLDLGLAIEIPDSSFEVGLGTFLEALDVLRPTDSTFTEPRSADLAD